MLVQVMRPAHVRVVLGNGPEQHSLVLVSIPDKTLKFGNMKVNGVTFLRKQFCHFEFASILMEMEWGVGFLESWGYSWKCQL